MDTRIPANAVASNALLEIGTCPRHNRRGERVKKLTFFTRAPLWVWILVVVSLLVAVIVLLAIRKRVQGQVHECAECIKASRTFPIKVALVWALWFGLLLAAGSNGNAALVAVWLIATLAALVYSFAGATHKIRGHLTDDRYWVVLKNADPGFRAAVDARVAAASGPPGPPA